jgi:hypothetical protein
MVGVSEFLDQSLACPGPKPSTHRNCVQKCSCVDIPYNVEKCNVIMSMDVAGSRSIVMFI